MPQNILFYSILIIFLNFSCNKTNEKRIIINDSKSINISTIKSLKFLIHNHPDSFLNCQDSIIKITDQFLPKSSLENEEYLKLFLNIGYALNENSQILKSIDYYEKAFEIYNKQKNSKIDINEFIIKPLGTLYTMTGDIDKAISIQYNSINNNSISQNQKASIYGNLAISIRQLNLMDSAIKICHQGLSNTKDTSVFAARLFNELSICYFEKNHIDSSLKYNQKSLDIFKHQNKLNQHPEFFTWQATAYSIKGQIDFKLNQFKNAIQNSTIGLSILEKNYPNSHLREKAKFKEQIGRLNLKLKHYNEAIKDFQLAILYLNPQHLKIYADNTITDAYLGLAQCYENLGSIDSAINYYALAIENDYAVQQFIESKESNYFNSSKGRKMLQQASKVISEKYQKVSDDKLKSQLAFQLLWITELSKGRQLINEINRSSNWNKNDSLSKNIFKSQSQLRYLYNTLSKETDVEKRKLIQEEINSIVYKTSLSENIFQQQFEAPNFDTFKAKIIKASTTSDIISWQINDSTNNYGISVSNGKANIFSINQSSYLKPLLAQFMNTYFYQGPNVFNNNPDKYFNDAEVVLNSILPNFKNYQQKQWILSLDAFLFGLPIEALPVNNQYLIQQKEIHPIYTLISDLNEKSVDSSKKKVALFAKEIHSPPFQNLNYIEDEIASIKQNVDIKEFKNKEANFNNFQLALNTSDIIHISTHAVSDSTNSQPFLVFDEKINLDKMQFALTKSPLVILSACETGKGKNITGEGMESLNKAFLSKGVKGVIAAQWTVEDKFIPIIMQNFYRSLAVNSSPISALRDAKLDYINSQSNPKMANPWQWASLNYMGKNVLVKVESANNMNKYLLWISIFGLGIGTVSYLIYKKKKIRRH